MGAESDCSMGMNFQSDGDGCTAMWMYLIPLKIVKMVNFMLCIVLHTQSAYDKARLQDEPWTSESGKISLGEMTFNWKLKNKWALTRHKRQGSPCLGTDKDLGLCRHYSI